MRQLLIVDDTEITRDWVSERIAERLRWQVVTAKDPDDLPGVFASHHHFNIALVDLSFATSFMNGLDALLIIHQQDPECALVVLTQGDPPVIPMLRDAWDAFPLASVFSKDLPDDKFTAALHQVAMTGTARVDPTLQPHLPRQRSPGRSLADYGNLVKHRGHAKLWQALIDLDTEPTYKELADHMRLSLLTVRNYRTELLEDLKPHKLYRPKMREMQSFAKRCRPLLTPHIRRKLPDGLTQQP